MPVIPLKCSRLASFPVSTPSFFSHVVKKAATCEKKLGVETGNEATVGPIHACTGMYVAVAVVMYMYQTPPYSLAM